MLPFLITSKVNPGLLILISADVVEVAPAYDHAEVTSLAAATIVYELTNLFAKSKG